MLASEPRVLVLAEEAAETEQKERNNQKGGREKRKRGICTHVLQMKRALDNGFKRMGGGDKNDNAFYS